MRLFKITNGFERMTDAYLLVRANTIKTDIAANPTVFNSPQPTLSEIGTLISAFQASVLKAEGGNKQDVAVKNADRQALIDALHLLGNYVLYTAAGDEVIATSSGFNISKVPQPSAPITNPENVQVKNGMNAGELELSCKRVKGARSYVHEITPAPVTASSNWSATTKVVSKNLFTGLESGKAYACRVAAIGIKDQIVYSDIITRIAI